MRQCWIIESIMLFSSCHRGQNLSKDKFGDEIKNAKKRRKKTSAEGISRTASIKKEYYTHFGSFDSTCSYKSVIL